ncbi:MAG: hypothetical protein ACRDHW_21425 [Ktedonobacteraceae bacterium]
MSLDRLRYELRLLGKVVFLTPLLVVCGLGLLIALVHRDMNLTDISRSMGASLEVLLPMAAGVVVATVATHDPALELQLTMPRKYHHTANARFLCILLWSAVVALLTSSVLVRFGYLRQIDEIAHWSQPWQFLTWQLNWLSSMLWLVALGLVLSLLLRSRAASGAVICAISIGEIVFHGAMEQNLWLFLVYLFPLTFSPDTSYWLFNRIELLGTAIVLLLVAWLLLRLPELLLSRAPGEE